MFGLQHKKEVVQNLDSFLSFLKKYVKWKAHNIMLDPRFKTLHLVSPLIGCEQDKAIVEEYDQKSLFPYVLKMLLSFGSIGCIRKGCCGSKGWRG
jgi:hypothetical protein